MRVDNVQNIRELIAQMNKGIDVARFLQATPFSTDATLRFDDKLTEQMFFDEFYAHSEEAIYAEKELHQSVESDINQVALVLGYKGCGKTTFVRYILRGEERIIIDMEGFIRREKTVQLALIDYLYGAFSQTENLNAFAELFCHDNKSIITERARATLAQGVIGFFDVCKKIAFEKRAVDTKNNRELSGKLSSMKIADLLTILVFFQLAYKTKNKILDKRTYVIFDNLDAIEGNDILNDFIKEFGEMFMGIIRNFSDTDKIWCKDWDITTHEALRNFVFTFVMRETTFSKMSDHSRERVFARSEIFYYDVSTMYARVDFVRKRKEFLRKYKEEFKEAGFSSYVKLESQIERIEKLLSDDYFCYNIFPMFNNDYRTIARTLTASYAEWKGEEFDGALTLLQTKDSQNNKNGILRNFYIRYGGRLALYRKLFDNFYDNDYFQYIRSRLIKVANINDPILLNLPRLLLSYLYSHAEDLRDNEFRQTKRVVPLLELFREFEKYGITPEDIVASLDGLFGLRIEEHWNHLVTFDNLASLTPDELEIIAKRYKEGELKEAGSPKVRITCAGRMCLKDLYVRFEYFAARFRNSNSVKKPLFLCTNIINGNTDGTVVFEFDRLLADVFCEIKNSYNSFVFAYIKIFSSHFTSVDQFACSRFNYWIPRNNNTSRIYEGAHKWVLHNEQIVFSAVGYVEWFRNYMFTLYDDDKIKKQINMKIVSVILKLLRLITDNSDIKSVNNGQLVVSTHADRIARDLSARAKQILRNNYADFSTRISLKKESK